MSSLTNKQTNKQTKKLKTREFEEKKIDRSAFGKGKTVKIREKLEKLEKKPVNVLGFFGKCPGLKNEKTPWIKSL